jgi:TctA family transporter
MLEINIADSNFFTHFLWLLLCVKIYICKNVFGLFVVLKGVCVGFIETEINISQLVSV